MKKTAIFLLLLATIFSPIAATAADFAISPSRLEARISAYGDVRGFNTYSALDRSDFAYFKAHGVKSVRIMFMDGDLLVANRAFDAANPAHQTILPNNLVRLKNLVALGQEFGVKLVIDVHETPGLKRWFLTPGESEDWRLWENSAVGEKYRSTLVGLWAQLAAELKKAPADAVIFELLNEPVPRLDPQDWANENYGYIWETLQDRLIREIRRQDRAHTIMAAPAYSWRPNSLDNWKPSNEVLRDKKIAIAVHAFYPVNFTYQWDAWSGKAGYKAYPGIFSEQYFDECFWDKQKIYQSFAPIRAFTKRYGKQVYVSEFGATRGAPGSELWLKDIISIMNTTPGIWGWSAHVWGETKYASTKGIAFDFIRGSMYEFAAEQAELDAVLGGL